MNVRKRVVAATPIICLIVFLILGFYFDKWHPGWLVFLFVPAMPFILGLKRIKHIYPVICAVVYVLIGIFWNQWHPGWIIFLTIPVVAIFTPSKKDKEKVEIID